MVSFSTKFFRKNKFLIFLFLICLFTRVSSSINYFEDIDSLRFGLSASEFNILESRPHFPGYAVFCFLLRTIFEIINNIEKVGNQEAVLMSRMLAKLEGIPVGISSGAALVAVKNCAKKEKVGSRIVVILPSFAERYLSTILFDGLT